MNQLKQLYIVITLLFLSYSGLRAQEGKQSYQYLNLPTSTRINALGGSNVSVVDHDISMVFLNPARLGPEMDMNLNVNYMSYLAGISEGSAIFGKTLTDISAFAVGVNYLNYGTFDGTTDNNISTGTFSASDIAMNAVYSRCLFESDDMTRNLRGGVTTKFLYSSYDNYSSTAIGFDLGLSYCKKEPNSDGSPQVVNFSAGLTLRNMGAQLSSYNGQKTRLPWDLQMGFTKRLSYAPIQFSVTGVYLTQWNFSRINAANNIEPSNGSFLSTAFKHLVIGVDFLPTNSTWLSLGYNPKVHSDMQLTTGNTFGGWSMGGGIRVNKFSVGASVSSYTKSSTSYHFSVAMDLKKY